MPKTNQAVSHPQRDTMSPEIHFFPVSYTWNDPQFGELTAGTVIIGADAAAALAHFRSRHPHLTGAWILAAHSLTH
ncbi:MAG: hypothetical protein KGL39_28345 [Patescibacteria group bacterium]|nr:hypothetical protein [Patescibacteria group bacterium]